MICIAYGYGARATITSITPIVYKLDMQQVTNWTQAEYGGAAEIKSRIIMRSCFCGSILLALLFVRQ